MKTIKVAESAGFCFGVKRAVDKVYELVEKGCKVYTLGPIIHNEDVVSELARKGVEIIDDAASASEILGSKDDSENDENVQKVLVIRSHGIDRASDEYLKKIAAESDGKLSIVDATCPFVKKIHKIVMAASDEGKTVIIAGNGDHPEVKGIVGWAKKNEKTPVFVVSGAEELAKIDFSGVKSLCLVAQTTFNFENFKELVEIIAKKGYNRNTSVVNTICNATEKRQTETRQLAAKSDAMIIIGGRHSSNTAKLFEISKSYCDACFFVRNAEELKKLDFSGFDRIGITAGASTPHNIIEEVQNTMEDFEQLLEENLKSIHNGEVVEGTVIDVKEDQIVLNIGYKADGIIPRSEYTRDSELDLREAVHVGDTLSAKILKVNDGDGQVSLSYRRASSGIVESKLLEEACENKTVVTGKVTDVVKGGLSVSVENARVFIPASLVSDVFEKDLSKYKNADIDFIVTEYSPKERRIIGDRKQLVVKEKAEKLAAALENIRPGDVFEGTVKNVTDFGAFVDIGDIDGLLHVSEMSWTRAQSPKKLFKVGDTVKVYVKDIKGSKIALSKKFDDENPWVKAETEFALGDVVKGKVARMAPFGAFVEIAPGIDALLHVSQILRTRVEKPEDVLKIGQEIEAKIVEFKPESKKISLSMKVLLPKEDKNSDDAVTVASTNDIDPEAKERAEAAAEAVIKAAEEVAETLKAAEAEAQTAETPADEGAAE